jgi:hypothetical protein
MERKMHLVIIMYMLANDGTKVRLNTFDTVAECEVHIKEIKAEEDLNPVLGHHDYECLAE